MAQDKCGTVEIQTKQTNLLKRESDEQFESWVRERRAARNGREESTGVYTIPVVVHVIHKGETVGTGSNLSDAQIISQIKVLNHDFTRTNTDASSTPAEFQSVAGSINFNFVLAVQDPTGKATSGIVRVKGSKNQWSTNDESTLKALSYWPAEDYLNIWVTDLSSTLLGYAQFPVSDLEGLEDATDNRLTDGVVIDYTVFGSNDDGSFSLTTDFNKGRTATHEIGHYFGLRHIWGDDNGACTGSDYVSDTPNQGNSTSGCPSNPQTTCSVHAMFQNYMDYTNDVCMNLFTVGQVARMQTVIENSPRRVSLLTSLGAEDPAPVPDDLGLVSIIEPASIECQASVHPSISLVNKGTNTVTKASFNISVNGVVYSSSVVFSQALTAGTAATVALDNITLIPGDNTISFEITSTNGVADGKVSDNELESTTYFPYATVLPVAENFNALPDTWRISTDATTNWGLATAIKSSKTNTAAYLDFFNAVADTRIRTMATPFFGLPAASGSYLVFDVAYAQSAAGDNDGLSVYVVSECNEDYTSGTQIYSRSGSALATTSIVTTPYTPTGLLDWRHEVIDLSTFKGKQNLRITFAGSNGGGNNIFVDDIRIVSTVNTDVSLIQVKNVSPVTCNATANASLLVVNKGSESISSLIVDYSVNSGSVTRTIFTDLNLISGDSTEISPPEIPLADGVNELSFTIQQPDGLFDVDSSDNKLIQYSVVNTATDIIPLRQNFNDGLNTWTIINPEGGQGFDSGETNYNQSLIFDAHVPDSVHEAWLVSPSFDLTTATAASVFFDVSFQGNGYNDSPGSKDSLQDNFQVLVSTDCGNSYGNILMDEAVTVSGQGIVPNSENSWSRKFVDLSAYAGQESVRVAFVLNSKGVSDFYLDNIEFFLSDDSTPVATSLPYTVYGTDPSTPQDFYITFNLSERQEVAYSIVDVTGRSLLTKELDDVLNQTFQVEPNLSAGIYILRIQIGGKWYSTRLYLNN